MKILQVFKMEKSDTFVISQERRCNMINLNIPVGISDFAQIRQNEYYYVDKSGLVSEILKTLANYLKVWRFQKKIMYAKSG